MRSIQLCRFSDTKSLSSAALSCLIQSFVSNVDAETGRGEGKGEGEGEGEDEGEGEGEGG
jgi:hypothetical protein